MEPDNKTKDKKVAEISGIDDQPFNGDRLPGAAGPSLEKRQKLNNDIKKFNNTVNGYRDAAMQNDKTREAFEQLLALFTQVIPLIMKGKNNE